VDGVVEVSDVHVDTRCTARAWWTVRADCTVDARYTLTARTAATLRTRPGSLDRVRVDDQPGTVWNVPEGDHVRVAVSSTLRLERTRHVRGAPWSYAPMIVRHPLFGDSQDITWRGGRGAVVLVGGPSVYVVTESVREGPETSHVTVALVADSTPRPVGADHEGPRSTGARLDQTLTVWLTLRAPAPSRHAFRRGGPVLGLGTRLDGSDAPDRPLLRLGYEASLYEYAFVSTSVETDLDSLYESLVVDLASRNVAILVPSFRVGVGMVARQLGPRPADFALRLRVGASLLIPLGGDVDFDYWPATQSWTVSLVGRLGL